MTLNSSNDAAAAFSEFLKNISSSTLGQSQQQQGNTGGLFSSAPPRYGNTGGLFGSIFSNPGNVAPPSGSGFAAPTGFVANHTFPGGLLPGNPPGPDPNMRLSPESAKHEKNLWAERAKEDEKRREKERLESDTKDTQVAITVSRSNLAYVLLFPLANCFHADTFATRVHETLEMTGYMPIISIQVKYGWWLDEWLKFDLNSKADFEFLLSRVKNYEGQKVNCVLQLRVVLEPGY